VRTWSNCSLANRSVTRTEVAGITLSDGAFCEVIQAACSFPPLAAFCLLAAEACLASSRELASSQRVAALHARLADGSVAALADCVVEARVACAAVAEDDWPRATLAGAGLLQGDSAAAEASLQDDWLQDDSVGGARSPEVYSVALVRPVSAVADSARAACSAAVAADCVREYSAALALGDPCEREALRLDWAELAGSGSADLVPGDFAAADYIFAKFFICVEQCIESFWV
jgi:hypothetical protein